MRFCIGIMFQNEADWLRLHLPVLMQAKGVGLVGLDGGSTDGGADVIREFGGEVYGKEYEWPPIFQRNSLINVCTRAGYDAMVKVDPDELFFPHHIEQMPTLLEEHKVLRMPTYNFTVDRRHYVPCNEWYPAWHERAWRLDCDLRYIGEFHSEINWRAKGLNWRSDILDGGHRDVLDCPHIHLFHYGDIKDRETRALRIKNINRFKCNIPLAEEWEGTVPPPPFRIPFVGAQPLDPDVCGDTAPIKPKNDINELEQLF